MACDGRLVLPTRVRQQLSYDLFYVVLGVLCKMSFEGRFCVCVFAVAPITNCHTW